MREPVDAPAFTSAGLVNRRRTLPAASLSRRRRHRKQPHHVQVCRRHTRRRGKNRGCTPSRRARCSRTMDSFPQHTPAPAPAAARHFRHLRSSVRRRYTQDDGSRQQRRRAAGRFGELMRKSRPRCRKRDCTPCCKTAQKALGNRRSPRGPCMVCRSRRARSSRRSLYMPESRRAPRRASGLTQSKSWNCDDSPSHVEEGMTTLENIARTWLSAAPQALGAHH